MSLPSACSDTQFIHLSDNSTNIVGKTAFRPLSLKGTLFMFEQGANNVNARLPGQEGRLDSVNGLSRDFHLHQFRRKEKFFF